MAYVTGAPVYLVDAITGEPVTSLGGDGGTGESPVAVANVSALASAAVSTELLAANEARRGLMATNTDANICYLKYGTGASATSFSAAIGPGTTWEMPPPKFTGVIHVIWTADGSGSLQYTEL